MSGITPHQPVEFARDCKAVQVPEGTEVEIPAGTRGRITQALGTSFTVVTNYGQMFRVEKSDADAVGLDPAEHAEEAKAEGPLEERVWDALGTCYDPEIPINIVELGLVYSCDIQPVDDELSRVDIKMTLTAPGCGMGDVIKAEVERKVEALDGVQACVVEIVFEPQWDQSMMSEAARLQVGLM